ncbi:MAG: acyl carrier protein [Clostridia bacterium]|nr:acyl carrier protein [Clostridia bacterium]
MLQRVIDFVASRLDVDAALVTAETNVMEDLGADSLDVVELVMAAEEYFGIKIEDEDIVSVKTIGDAVSYLENKL